METSFDYYINNLRISDVLSDAGYSKVRGSGVKSPTFARFGTDGKTDGVKFVVIRDDRFCFVRGTNKPMNVVSLIMRYPELFKDYYSGMKLPNLVNKVCGRLLNRPRDLNSEMSARHDHSSDYVFNLKDYEIHNFVSTDWETQKPFYPYFKNRGITNATERAFSEYIMLTTRESNGKKYTNISFPLRKPTALDEGIVGFELRSRPNEEGKSAYKGLAPGSSATDSLWMAYLKDGKSNPNLQDGLHNAKDVYWFESAYDAMAYYQLHKGKKDFSNALFVSTSGQPSATQLKGLLKNTSAETHHLCFDNDQAGKRFALAVLMSKSQIIAQTSQNASTYILSDYSRNIQYDLDLISPLNFCKSYSVINTESGEVKETAEGDIEFDQVSKLFGIGKDELTREVPELPYKDWNDQLLNKPYQEIVDAIEQRNNQGLKI